MQKENSDPVIKILLKLASPIKPVPVQTVDSIRFIQPEEIAFIESGGTFLEIVDTSSQRWKRFDTVTAMEKRLSSDPLFLKISRSAIVNLRQVKALYTTTTGSHEISFRTLDDKIRISIADSSYSKFKAAMSLTLTDEKALNPGKQTR